MFAGGSLLLPLVASGLHRRVRSVRVAMGVWIKRKKNFDMGGCRSATCLAVPYIQNQI